MWIQPFQAEENPAWQAPAATSFLAAAATSGQVLGGLSGSSPAFLKASTL